MEIFNTHSQAGCSICNQLSDRQVASQKYGWEENDASQPQLSIWSLSWTCNPALNGRNNSGNALNAVLNIYTKAIMNTWSMVLRTNNP